MFEKIPKHLGLIINGHRRYGQAHAIEKQAVYEKTLAARHYLYPMCLEIGVEALSIFVFGIENFKRGPSILGDLDSIVSKFIDLMEAEYLHMPIHFVPIGNLDLISDGLRGRLLGLEAKTRHQTKLVNLIAVAYSGQWDMAQAAEKARRGLKPGEVITPELIQQNLATAPYPDVDLLIRTGGEQRISNFMLWQAAYAELYFTEKTYPEFTKEEFLKAIAFYQTRDRRFGGQNY